MPRDMLKSKKYQNSAKEASQKMNEKQFMEHSEFLKEMVGKYNSSTNVIKIRVTLSKYPRSYLIKGRDSQCHVIFDPLSEVPSKDMKGAFIAHTKSELTTIIDYIRANPDLYLPYSPDGDDVYDHPDILVNHYDESELDCGQRDPWMLMRE